MASDKRKEFLNVGILGSEAGVPERRAFRAIKTDYISAPDYNARFFETFPTVWASAYAFRKELAAEKPTEQGTIVVEDEATIATTKEWMSLFLLYYFGRIRLVEYKREALEKEYDKDLWLALNGTYPSAREGNLSSVFLLETNEGTVVGAYYPEVIFFPSRGRAGWMRDETLQQFLVGSKLSWDLCRQNLLGTDDRKTHDFHVHLELVARRLPGKTFKERVAIFLRGNFHDRVDVTGLDDLDPDPSKWETPYNKPPGPEELLAHYPLALGNAEGGKNYYLVAGLPDEARTQWMKTAVVADATPLHYRGRKDDQVITVQVRGKNIACPLVDGKDHIIPLKDLFLTDAPYWCKVGRANDVYTNKLRSVHRVDLRDPILKQDEFALCLAPIRREMLAHFPSLFQNIQFVTATPDLQRPRVSWTFHLNGYEVSWQTAPIAQSEMPNTSLALWPPKVSEKWRFYIAYGKGIKATSGRWHLVDENGSQGQSVPLEDDVYASILPHIGRANRPRALLFTDNNDNERGVLFLSELEKQNVDADQKATLAVDFGTSNTCLAYRKGEASEVIKFKLSPLMLWGQEPEQERPGFVPFKWGGKKGFFPTILLSRRSATELERLKADDIKDEHLFKIDIPGLHKEMEERLVIGQYSDTWENHANLKWDLGIQSPWRPLFLGLTLLYAHAENFFKGQEGAEVDRYVFTFPLAFSDPDQKAFHDEAKKIIVKIRQMCYGVESDLEKLKYVGNIDESTAIARANRAAANPALIEVFIDVGGGTADIAIRCGNNFLVLDSIKVAGNTFFRIAKKNFDDTVVGAATFRQHLAQVLHGPSQSDLVISNHQLDLGTYYSLLINKLEPDEFTKKEGNVLQRGMGAASYQRYRTRLFFRHIVTYALLQACATAVGNKLTPQQGIKLIMGGNAWGMMMFAEFPRKSTKLKEESANILSALKKRLTETVPEDQRQAFNALKIAGVELLNEEDLSKAKTGVALGALVKPEAGLLSDKDLARPYTGITIRGLKVEDSLPPATVHWYDRWGFEELKTKLGAMDEIQSAEFEPPADLSSPLDPGLVVFTILGNARISDQDNMPGETWTDMNSEVCEYVNSIRGNRLGHAPINHFISNVLYPSEAYRDFLNTLAEINNNYKDGQ